MPFTGKASYSSGATLPEIVEDVSDLVGIVSPFETPLLDHLGDPMGSAVSTTHEWLEDALLPNADRINQSTFTPDATSAASITVENSARFRPGDQVRPDGSTEVMLVNAIVGDAIIVSRAYGGTFAQPIADDQVLRIIGNAALEGDDRPETRFNTRVRRQNYTQIFTASVEVSGTMMSTSNHGVSDELDYQKQARLRELMRDLENTVINGVDPATSPQGSQSTRRTIRGILDTISTNTFSPGDGILPEGDGPGSDGLNEPMLNAALKRVWEQSSGNVDTIVVGGSQKRRINTFISAERRYGPTDERVRDMVSMYESDFGVCRVVLTRWVPDDTIILLDSSRVHVLPLQGRSFHYKPLASTGDSEVGQLIGEYTLELMNEVAHGVIRDLAL